MEVQISKNVRAICDLKPGDKVKTDKWGPGLDNKILTVERVEFDKNFQSWFAVKLKEYHRLLSSDWLIKTS